tara:strand:+ start:216 stop:539 length:324 start_codon:yes stop_codon:yes gene_type:complete
MITSEGLEQLGFNPKTDFVLRDDGDGVYIESWNSASPQPSVDDIEAAHAEWQAEQDATKYQRDREAEYPTLNELVVALWEAVIEERMASSIDLQGKRTAVKDKYPKP